MNALRSGPVETYWILTPTCCSSSFKYVLASGGNFANLVNPFVLELQPFIVL